MQSIQIPQQTYLFDTQIKLKFYIKILDINNNEFARGLSSFSSEEILKIMGHHSNQIQSLLGYISKSEVVHKDDMVEI